MIFMLLPLALIAFAVLILAWIVTLRDVPAAPPFGWRQTLASVGLIASTLLVPLPFIMALFFIDPHNQPGLAWSMGIAALLFVLSLAGAFTHRVLLCIGLILSSLFFLGFCGAVYAIGGWQF